MTPMPYDNYRVGLPINKRKKCKLLLNSDEKRFGGQGAVLPAEIMAVKNDCDGKEYSIQIPLPPYGAAVYKI